MVNTLAKLRGSILLRDVTGVLGLWTTFALRNGDDDDDDGVKGILEGGALLLLFLSVLLLNSNGWPRGGLLLILQHLDNGVKDLLGVDGEVVLLLVETFDLV